MKLLRVTILAGAAMFGGLVAVRALAGPLSFPFSIRTPINIESFCGFLLTAAFLLRAGADLTGPMRARMAWAIPLAALVSIAFWRGSSVYFLADDFVHVARANSFNRSLVIAFWTTPEGNAFFRPLGHMFLAGMALWSHFDPRWWHWNILAVHAANVVLVYVLGTRLGLARHAALFAGALFAIHGAMPESAVWITGWFGVLPAFFTLAGLLVFLKYFENPWWAVATVLCMALAFLSKESAYAFPLIAALMVVARRIPWRRALPILAALFGTALLIFIYRWNVLGGIGGYTDPKSGGVLMLHLGGLQVLRSLLLRIWAVLYFPINWSVQPEWWLGAATLAYVAALVWLCAGQRRRLAILFPFGFVLLAALPPLEQLLIGPDLQKSRALYLPIIGFALMLGVAMDGLAGKTGLVERMLVPAAILLFQFAALQHNLTIWQHAGLAVKQACADASRCVKPDGKLRVRDVPGSFEGVYFLGAGLGECVGIQITLPPPELHVEQADAGDESCEVR